MFADLFDSPWKILIVAIVIIVLFGSRKLPAAARSLGQSMRILKTEVQGLHEDNETQTTHTAPATTAAPAQIRRRPPRWTTRRRSTRSARSLRTCSRTSPATRRPTTCRPSKH